MLRYDLFDVDRAVAATVTWAIVATALALAFGTVTTVAGALLGASSRWVAAAATAACAAALLPLHRAVNRWIGARLYPARRAALAAISALERGVATGSAQPEQLESVLAEALHMPGLRIGYVLPETGSAVDVRGRPITELGMPIEAADERIGVLVAADIASGLRRELAAASVMHVNVVRLRLHLTHSLAEVEASRARLVSAEDAARRRFERDLHDGAQQRLVSLGVTLRLAQRRIRAGVDEPEPVIDAAVAELTTAIAELRQLAHGIRPSVLDDGLTAAVQSLARTVPLPVDLSADVDDVGEPTATTAYYLVAESLANTVKHAGANGIRVCIRRDDDVLRVSVSDDGCGGADRTRGTGLAGLDDRVAALGGRLDVRSELGAGTTVEAELPYAS